MRVKSITLVLFSVSIVNWALHKTLWIVYGQHLHGNLHFQMSAFLMTSLDVCYTWFEILNLKFLDNLVFLRTWFMLEEKFVLFSNILLKILTLVPDENFVIGNTRKIFFIQFLTFYWWLNLSDDLEKNKIKITNL